MSKGLTKGLIDMYCDMVNKEYQPLLEMLEARTHNVRPIVERQVRRDLGLYDLLAKKASLEVQLQEIERQLNHLTKSQWHASDNSYYGVIDREVNRRLEELNGPAAEVKNMISGLKKKIMLSTASEAVVALFDKIAEDVANFTERFQSLPPIEQIIGITEGELEQLRSLE